MGELKDVLANVKSQNRIDGVCKIGAWIATLSPEDAADAKEIFATNAPDAAIRDAISPFIRVSHEIVRQHKRGICLCHR